VVLAIDQGTSGTTCLVVDGELRPRGRGFRAVRQYYPRPGWVEHDPEDIWQSVVAATEQALVDASVRAGDVQAIGITNQRETTLLWDRRSGEPVQRAIVWQDRRTAERCRELPKDLIRARTGLVPDPYFSATKLEWLLRDRSPDGLAFGTVDSWLVWKLTGGRVHATDVTNASRTMLLRLDTLDWDDELLELFGVERSLLPEIRRSNEVVGDGELSGASAPIAGIAGDQQASLFGHGCSTPVRQRRRTAPATSCSSTRERLRPFRRTGSSPLRPPATTSTRSKGPSSSPARRSNGCRTASVCSPTQARARRSRARSMTTAASTSCRRSPASARRTGAPTRVASSPA